MHPVFWEGKGNGKHEIEKFLQKKYHVFCKKVLDIKKPSVIRRVFEVIFKDRIASLFFVLVGL